MIHETPNLKGSFKEGDRVKLNLKSITEQPDYSGMSPKYKKFVEDSKDKLFTVQCDPKDPTNETVMCLLEDDSEIKWRFWVGHFEKVKSDE